VIQQFLSIGQAAHFSSVQNETRIFIQSSSPLCRILFSHQRSFTSMIILIDRKKFIQNNLRNKKSKQMMIRDCRVYRWNYVWNWTYYGCCILLHISFPSSSLETKCNVNLKFSSQFVSLLFFYSREYIYFLDTNNSYFSLSLFWFPDMFRKWTRTTIYL